MLNYLPLLAIPSMLLAFNDWIDVKDLSFAIAEEFHCGCAVIMFPSKSPFGSGLLELGRLLARQPEQPLQLTADIYGEAADLHSLSTCFNPLFISVETRETRKDLETLSKTYRFHHSTWLLITAGEKSLNLFENLTLTLASNLFSVSMGRDSEFVLSEIFRVTSDFPVRASDIGVWSRRNGLRIKIDPPHKRHSNMEGLLWRVGTIENWPIVSFNHGDAGKGDAVDGFFAKIWLELQRILNFTSVFMLPSDKTSGKRLLNGSWSGLCGMLVMKEADVIVSEFSMSSERHAILEGLLPLLRAKLNVYYRPEGVSWNWYAVLQPFDRNVWIMILIWLITSTFVLIFMSWVACRCGLPFTSAPGNNGFFALQTLCQQGAPETPRFWAGRIFFVTCYLTSAVLFPCYSASLISSLTHRTPLKPFDSLKEMIHANYPIVICDNMVEYEFFEQSSDPFMKQALKQLAYMMTAESEMVAYASAYVEMCTKNVAFFSADSVIETQFWNLVPGCSPLRFSQPLAVIHQAFALPKNSPYRELLNCNILRLREFGIVSKLYSQYMTFTAKKDSGIKARTVIFSDVIEIFIFLAVAMIISIFILLAEVIVYSKRLK